MEYRMSDSEEKKIKRKKYIQFGRASKIKFLIQIIATILLWLISIYCFKDVIYSIYMLFHNVNIIRAFPVDAVVNVLLFGITALVIIIVWMIYNKMMFGGRDRRKSNPVWTEKQIEELYKIDYVKHMIFKNGKVIDIDFYEDNNINNVRMRDDEKII